MSATSEFLKAVGTTAAREGTKIAATRALGRPIDSVIDALGDVTVAIAGDRSPGSLGRGKERPLRDAERVISTDEKGNITKMLDSRVRSTLDERTGYGAPGLLGEKVYDKYLTDTQSTYQGLNKEESKKAPPRSFEEAQARYFTPKGNIRSTYAQALGFSEKEAEAASKGIDLPGLRGQPSIREDNYSLEAHRQKTSDNPFINFAYNHPEAIGHGITYGTPLAGIAGVGLATYFATKPKSDYALGIGPSTGNSNIDAARASAHYQQQTAQMKFEHQMQLQQARQQAQTPGRQNYGKALGLGLPDTVGGDGAREAYNMATSIIGATTPIYK